VYGPPLASVGYRNHGLQTRVETTYGYNPLELAAYADYADAAERDPSLISGFAATHDLTADGHVQPAISALPLAYFPSGAGTAIVLGGSEASLTVHYAARAQDLLRVAIPFYPGWAATLNGHGLSLTRTDGAFTGVTVPAGDGDVELAYTPRFFQAGATISGLALIVVLVALLIEGAAQRFKTGNDVVDARFGNRQGHRRVVLYGGKLVTQLVDRVRDIA